MSPSDVLTSASTLPTRGRPKSEDRMVPLTVWVPGRLSSHLRAVAERREVCVSELVRVVLVQLSTGKREP